MKMIKKLKNKEIIHTKYGLKTMSWMSKKTGRRKEEGGHKRINVSVDDFTYKALKKIRKGDGNVSRFIEKQLRPVLENLDPGEASIHIWRIEAYLNGQIMKAMQKDNPELVQALASIAAALKDFRNLCGIPPPNFWRDEENEHIETRRSHYVNEPFIFTLITTAFISLIGFIVTRDLSNQALPKIANQTSSESTQILRFMVQVSPYLVLTPLFIVILVSALKARHWLRTKLNLISTTNVHS